MAQYVKAYTAKKPSTPIEVHQANKTTQVYLAKLEEQKIAAMGLNDLKSYACPKALQHDKDWYMTCVSCSGNSACKPGRRALEILENDTKPDEKVSAIDKFNARVEAKYAPNIKGVNKKYALVGKEAFIETLKQPDPVEYIMKMNGTSKHGARQRLLKWKRKWPDVVEQYNKDLKQQEINNKYSRPILKIGDGRIAHNNEMREQARAFIEAAFTDPDGVYAHFEKYRGISDRTTVRGRIKNYIKVYPDLDEKLHMSEWAKANRCTPGKRNNNLLEEVKVHMVSAPIATVEKEDEISVEDFLQEMSERDAENKPEVVKKVASIQDIQKEEPKVVKKIETSEKIDDDLHIACKVFSEKRKSLARNIETIKAGIEQYQKELAELMDKLNKLDAAAEIMGFAVRKKES